MNGKDWLALKFDLMFDQARFIHLRLSLSKSSLVLAEGNAQLYQMTLVLLLLQQSRRCTQGSTFTGETTSTLPFPPIYILLFD